MSIKYGENDTPAPTEMVYGANDKPADQPKASAIRKLGDLATGFGVGAIGATKAIADAAGAGNKVSGFLESANKDLSGLLSPQAIADQQEQAAIQKEAAGKGIYEEAKAGIKAFGVAPLQTTVGGVASMVPILAATALGGLPGAAAAGAAIGAGTAKGAIYDDIKARGTEKGLSAADAESAAATAQEYGGKNTDQIALGAGLGILDSATGASGIAGGMVRKALGKPVAALAARTSERGILGRAGMGMLEEMPVEFAQGAQERVAANIAAQREGYQANTWDNAVSGGTLEALASAGPGAGFGMMNGRPAPPAPGAAPSTAPDAPAPAPNAPQLGFNPAAGTMAVFPDGSTILDSESSNGAQAVRDMQRANRLARVGVADPAPNSPLTNAALAAVDSGAHDAAIAAQQATAGANASGQASMQGQPAPQNDLALPGAIPALPGGALQQSQSAGGSPQSPVRPLESAVSAGQGAPQTSSKAEAGAQAQTLQAGESGSSEIPTSASAQSKSSTPQTVSPSSSPIENPIVAAPAPTQQERLAALRAELDTGTDAKGAPLNDFTRGMRTAQIRSLITQLPKAEIEAARAKYDPAPAAPSTTTQTAPDFQVGGVDEAVKAGLGAVTVSQGGKPVPFKDFSLLVHEDGTAEASVERASNSQGGVKGSGFGAYVALGNELAARGVKLVSGDRQHGPGKDLWARLTQAGYAQRQPGGRHEFVAKAAPDQANQQPQANSVEFDGIKTSQPTPQGATSEPQASQAIPQQTQPEARAAAVASTPGEVAPAAPAPRPATWRTFKPQAMAVARKLEIDTKGMNLDAIIQAVDQRDEDNTKWVSQNRVGKNGQPINEGGVPFKTSFEAKKESKRHPTMRVVPHGTGYALADKTTAQLEADKNSAKRLRSGQTSPAGQPIPAHAFIANEGGLRADTRPDMRLGGNPRIGGRTLFAGAGKGIGIEKATARLIEEGYLNPGASHDQARALIKRSLNPATPQYNHDGTTRMAEMQDEAARVAAQTENDAQAEAAYAARIAEDGLDSEAYRDALRSPEPEFEDYLAAQQDYDAPARARQRDELDWVDDDFTGAGFDEASLALQNEIMALSEQAGALGIDVEALIHDAHDTTASKTNQDYYELAISTLEAAIDQKEAITRGGKNSRQNDGQQGNAPAAGEGAAQSVASPAQETADQRAPEAQPTREVALYQPSPEPGVRRPVTWRNNRFQAGAIARELGHDVKGMKLAEVVALVDRADTELTIQRRDSVIEKVFEMAGPPVSNAEGMIGMLQDDLNRLIKNPHYNQQDQANAVAKLEQSIADYQAILPDVRYRAEQISYTEAQKLMMQGAKSELDLAVSRGDMTPEQAAKAVGRAFSTGNVVDASEEIFNSVDGITANRLPAPAPAAQDALTAPTAQDIIDQQDRAEAAAQAEKSQQRAADERARLERERKDIAKASKAAADTFELGGNAEQNLSGQQSVFDAPAEQAPAPKSKEVNNAREYGVQSAKISGRREAKDKKVQKYNAEEYAAYLEGFDAQTAADNARFERSKNNPNATTFPTANNLDMAAKFKAQDEARNTPAPAIQAATILDAANITGKERIDAIKDVKKGDVTPDELEAAYPAKDVRPKPQRIPQSLVDMGFKILPDDTQHEATWTSAEAAPYTRLSVRHAPNPDRYRVTQGGRLVAPVFGENALPTKEIGVFFSEAELLDVIRPIVAARTKQKLQNPEFPAEASPTATSDAAAKSNEKLFYVTMIRGDQVARLAGPFDTETQAEEMIFRAQQEAGKVDPRSAFDSFGVTGITEISPKFGVLNKQLGLPTGVAASEPVPATTAPATPAPVTPKSPNNEAARAAYYTPGNVILSHTGTGNDEVLSYTPQTAEAGWQVKVQPVKRINGKWEKVGRAVTHRQLPDYRHMAVGNVRDVDEMGQKSSGDAIAPAAPVFKYAPASTIETMAQGALANATDRKERAYQRLKTLRAQVKDGRSDLRLELIKAESAHKDEIRAVDGAKEQIEKDANKLGLTTKKPPAFSRATTQTKGMTAAQVQAIAEKISAGWTNAPRIIVATNMADERIPQAARDEDQRQRATGATGSPEGFVHDGTVYLLADQLASPERAATVLMHEALGHIGLQGVFGDSLKTILQQVATMRQADIKAKAKQYGLDMSDPAQRLQAAEEVLAEMAQSRPEIGFVKRAVAAIRNWLRANVPGFRSLALTDADIVQQFILPARRYVTDGVSRDSGRSAATSPSLNKSNSDEFIADSALANSKIFPNFSNGKAFAKKGFGGLDIPTQRVVLARVISAMQDLEIADSVISLLPINMVNVLTGEKLPTKVVFHDQSMLINLLSAIRDDAIPLTVDSSTALIKAAAHNIAKRGGIFPKSAWPSGNGFSALGTNNGRPLIYSKGSLAFDSAKVVNRPSSLVGVTGEDGAAMGAIDSVHDDIVQQVRGWVERGRVAVSGGNTPMFSRSPAAANTAWATPEKSEWFDDLTYKLQDKQIDTKRVIEAIRTASGALADERNVYLQESLYHGRAAARSEDFVNKELGPLVNAMRMRGLDIAALDEYLHARHAEEANKLIAGRNPDIPDGGSGMTTADARAYLAGLDAGQRAKLEAVATQVDAILAKTRQLYADYSLESQKTVDGWSAMFAHYVPLMREDDSGGVGIGQGFSIKGRETRSRTGSTRKVVDILANIAMQRERAIIRGEKNRVATALVGLAEANPNKEFWHTGPPPSEKVYDAKLNKVVSRPDPMYKSRENVLMAKIKKADGTVIEKAVVFNEDNERAMRMSAALKNLDAAHLEGLLGVSAKVTRYFSAVNTQFNPIFGVVNLVRDVQSAILNLSSTPLKGKGVQVASHVFSALNGVYQDARAARNGQTPNSPWAALHEEFRQEGGQTGFRDAFTDSNDRANAIRRELNPGAWMDSPLGKIFTAGGALKVPLAIAQKRATGLFGWLSDYNLAMENAVRLSAYKVAREQGMSKQQAASLAKELTVNFNRKGQVGSQAGALYAFFNASMQGTARLGETLFSMEPGKPKTLRLSATGRNIVLGGVTLGVMQALLLSAAGFDDEEPPDFVRERSLIIPTGWLAGPDKGYITIPMPLGLHVLPNMGRIPTEFALNGFKNPEKQTARLFSIITGAFNPVGGGASLLQTLAPTAIDPLAALAENKDWTGKNIAKTSRNPATPGHLLTKDTASYPAKLLAEAINVMSGGTEYVAGVLSPTPDQIDYLWSQATGGVGREVSKAQQSVSTVFSGEDLPINKIPLAGRFYGNADTPSAQSNKFYSAIDRLNRHEEQIKGLRKNGRGAEVAAYLAENPDARLFMAANAAERQVQNLRTEKHKLLKKDAPAERVRLIEGQIAKRMTAFNELVQRTAR